MRQNVGMKCAASIAIALSFTCTAYGQATAKTVVVHIDSGEEVVLQRQDEFGEWRGVCVGECNQPIAIGSRLRIGGDAPTSAPFILRSSPDNQVTLTVKTGSRGAALGGGVAIGFGAAAVTAAPFFAVLGGAECLFHGPNCFSGFSSAAILLGVGGGVLMIVGIVVVALTAVTTVDDGAAVQRPQLPTKDAEPKLTFSNETAITQTIPLLHGIF